MGWAGGSALAEDIWLLVSAFIPVKHHEKVAKELVELFESEDCDTMYEAEELMDAAGLHEDDEDEDFDDEDDLDDDEEDFDEDDPEFWDDDEDDFDDEDDDEDDWDDDFDDEDDDDDLGDCDSDI